LYSEFPDWADKEKQLANTRKNTDIKVLDFMFIYLGLDVKVDQKTGNYSGRLTKKKHTLA